MRPLDLATLTSLVSGLPRFGKVSYFASVESTNALAVDQLHTNDGFGISFVTESQTLGRGRAGRTWESPEKAGVYVSTILPAELPAGALPAVGFWASLAVHEACMSETGVRLELKWPNDLLWQGRKCVGILSQARWDGQAARVVVGVGINVNRPPEVTAALANSAVWLSEIAGRELDRTSILVSLLSIYERDFDCLGQQPNKVIEDWAGVANLTGRSVKVKSADGSALHEGIVRAIDADGALVLWTSAGLARVTLGDVEAVANVR
jgi:BirA family transcriptional regulator, biotin operon repressor / biotin---[acetyl-CoA-carboxylase] ligase